MKIVEQRKKKKAVKGVLQILAPIVLQKPTLGFVTAK